MIGKGDRTLLYEFAPMYQHGDLRLRNYHLPAVIASIFAGVFAVLAHGNIFWGLAYCTGALTLGVIVTELICATVKWKSLSNKLGAQGGHTAAFAPPVPPRSRAAADAPPTIPPRRRELWSSLRTQYDDPTFASWVIATGPTEATDEDLLSIAHASHPDWEPQHRSSEHEIARHEAAHAIAAHVLGAVVLGAALSAEGKSSVEYVMPLSGPKTRDAAWRRMVINVAGRALDRSEGRSTNGSTDDLAKALLWAHAILSTGTPPEGYEGPMTTDGLMTAAHGAAERLVVAYGAYVDDIAETLVCKTVIGGSELREILPPHP